MIQLHRLTHPEQPFYLNPDKILTVESTPDTVVSLDDGSKLVVIESPDQLASEIRDWRAGILARVSLERGVLRAAR